jgi:hypothetical protein
MQLPVGSETREVLTALGGGIMVPSLSTCFQDFTAYAPCTVDSLVGAIETSSLVENRLANSVLAGAVVGSPGTMPTGYTKTDSSAGLTTEVAGISSGVEVKLSGTSSGTLLTLFKRTAATEIATIVNKLLSGKLTIAITGGSLTASKLSLILTEYDSGGNVLVSSSGTAINAAGTHIKTYKTVNAACAFVGLSLIYAPANGEVVDVTLRISEPQLERGPPRAYVPTTDVAIVDPRPYYCWTQTTAGKKPWLRKDFSYKPMVSGTTGETWTFTGTPIAGRAGLQKQTDGSLALRCSGTVGNYASTPDSVANSLTGDQTFIVELALDDWTTGTTQYFTGKYGADGQRAFWVAITAAGAIVIYLYPTGGLEATKIAYTSSVAVSAENGVKIAIKISCDLSDGVNSVVTFSTCTDFNKTTRTGSWVQLGTPITGAIIPAIHDSTAALFVGAISSAFVMAGKVYYAAAFPNLDASGTPAWKFYPNRDGSVPSNYYLDFDGSDDNLETDITPGLYDAGYVSGSWTQMETLGSGNIVFGSSGSDTRRGVRIGASVAGYGQLVRYVATTNTAQTTANAIAAYVPFVVSGNYTVTSADVKLDSGGAVNSVASRDYRGSSQFAMLGAGNNSETIATPTATQPMQGYMFCQVWSPVIPTADQQATIERYLAQLGQVTL